MKKIDLFNDESLCVFTDSSFKNQSTDKSIALGVTAPAFCIYHGDNLIESGFHILHNSTSQQGELYALLLGVMSMYKYRNSFKYFRLFSDSQNGVFAIRDRIFNWVRDTNNGKPVLGEEGRINNQPYIMDIVYTIISNNIPIEIYHVKGHVDLRKYKDVQNAKSVFIRSNLLPNELVDDALIYHISSGNNTVDQYSTAMLKSNIKNKEYFTDKLTPAVTIGYAPFDMRNYLYLVNGSKLL